MYKCIASNKVGRDERLIYFYVTSEYCGHPLRPHQPSSVLERGRSLDLPEPVTQSQRLGSQQESRATPELCGVAKPGALAEFGKQTWG